VIRPSTVWNDGFWLAIWASKLARFRAIHVHHCQLQNNDRSSVMFRKHSLQ
jgi:hypothetical protein